MTIIAGKREHGKQTLEVWDGHDDEGGPNGDLYIAIARHRDMVGGGTYIREGLTTLVPSEYDEREAIVLRLAAALGIDVGPRANAAAG